VTRTCAHGPGISVAIITVVNTLGGQLEITFTSVSTALGNAGQ
jgi:Flp pilus assembly pilin Flp